MRFESGQATGDSKATGNRNRDADPRWVLCVELRPASHMADARSVPNMNRDADPRWVLCVELRPAFTQ